MKKLIMLLGGWCFCTFVYLIIGYIISPQPNAPHIPSHDEIGINDAKNREEAVKIALFTDRHLVHANNFDFVLENMLHKALDEIRDNQYDAFYPSYEHMDDPQKVLDDLKELKEYGIDGLIIDSIHPIDDEILNQIAKLDLPCVFTNHEMKDFEYGDRTCFIGGSPYDATKALADMVSSLENQGDIHQDGFIDCSTLSHGINDPDMIIRNQYYVDALNEMNIPTKFRIDEQIVPISQNHLDEVHFTIGRFPEVIPYLDLVVCSDDDLAGYMYLEAANAKKIVGKDIHIINYGWGTETREAIRIGKITGTITIDEQKRAELIINQLIDMIHGKKPDKPVTYVPYISITKENLDQFDAYKC